MTSLSQSQAQSLLALAHEVPADQAVLATVVRVEGSAYRQPGARMLILADGRTVGMVSGGCLERHLVQRAFWLTRQGACVQVYRTGEAEADVVEEAFGLGCNGTISILFQRVSDPEAAPLLQALQQVLAQRRVHSHGLVIASSHTSTPLGRLMDPDALQLLSRQATTVDIQPASRKSPHRIHTLHFKDQRLEILHESVQPPIHLVICGSGLDTAPLIGMAKLLGWCVTVVDARADRLRKPHLQAADQRIIVPLEQADPLVTLSQNAAVAIMSHSLSQDRVWLQQLLGGPARYVGQLGPRDRTQRLLDEINASPDARQRLHFPIGLPLGGDSAEAVALSIVAHIQSVWNEPDA